MSNSNYLFIKAMLNGNIFSIYLTHEIGRESCTVTIIHSLHIHSVFFLRSGMDIDYCGARTEPNVDLNCNDSKVIRVERVYFGATPTLKCPPPHNCGTFDIEETERLRINCNRYPTCATPANFPLVDCEGQMIDSTSLFVTYHCVQGKQILGLLHRENWCFGPTR